MIGTVSFCLNPAFARQIFWLVLTLIAIWLPKHGHATPIWEHVDCRLPEDDLELYLLRISTPLFERVVGVAAADQQEEMRGYQTLSPGSFRVDVEDCQIYDMSERLVWRWAGFEARPQGEQSPTWFGQPFEAAELWEMTGSEAGFSTFPASELPILIVLRSEVKGRKLGVSVFLIFVPLGLALLILGLKTLAKHQSGRISGLAFSSLAAVVPLAAGLSPAFAGYNPMSAQLVTILIVLALAITAGIIKIADQIGFRPF